MLARTPGHLSWSRCALLLVGAVWICSVGCQEDLTTRFKEIGPGGTESVGVIPDDPPAGTDCNKDNWCWIHPAPFPHRIQEIRTSGNAVRGVVYSFHFRGAQPFVWDESGFDILDVGIATRGRERRIVPVRDGWLAARDADEFVGILPDGSVETLREFEEPQDMRFSGASRSDYLLKHIPTGGEVVRDGETTHDFEHLPGMSRTVRMWLNGEIWGVADTESSDDPPSGWNLLRSPENESLSSPTFIGPGPTAGCADGFWWGENRAGGIRWSSPEAAPTATDREFRAIEFGCDGRGNLLAISSDHEIWRRADGEWTRQKVSSQPIFSTTVVDGRALYGGGYGTFMTETDQGYTSLTSGLRMTEESPNAAYSPDYHALWVSADATTAFLSSEAGARLGTKSDGWNALELPEFSDEGPPFSVAETVRTLWGQDEFEWLLTTRVLYERTSEGWQQVNVPIADELTKENFRVEFRSSDEFWLAGGTTLWQYKDGIWSEKNVERRVSELGDIYEGPEGGMWVTAAGEVFRVTGERRDWKLNLEYQPPCPEVGSVHRSKNGTIYFGTKTCVAVYRDGSWTKYTPKKTSWQVPRERRNSDEVLGRFVSQPGDAPPALYTETGVFVPEPDGNLERVFVGDIVDAQYIPKLDATWLLTPQGVVAKYD